MKYHINYECRSNGNVFHGNIEIESPVAPTNIDKKIIEIALKDSVKFHQEGLAGIEILAITLLK